MPSDYNNAVCVWNLVHASVYQDTHRNLNNLKKGETLLKGFSFGLNKAFCDEYTLYACFVTGNKAYIISMDL